MPSTEQNSRLNITCYRFGTEAEFENREEAEGAGWRQLQYEGNSHWFSPEAMEDGGVCPFCNEYIDRSCDDYLCDIDGDGEIYHSECARDHGAFWCTRCECDHWTDNVDEVEVFVHRENWVDTEYWCRDCADESADWDDDDQEYHFWTTSAILANARRGQSIKKEPDGIKPEICEDCRARGCGTKGECDKCLKNQAYNKVLKETTLWVYDDRAFTSGFYHPREHVDFKKLFYRDKGEHPFLYYGIEWEVGFDLSKMKHTIEEVAKEFVHRMNGLCVCESDSSIVDKNGRPNGVEFIFRPMTYKMASKASTIKMFKDAVEYLISEGAYVEQPEGNGIHIHLSRRFFEHNTEKDVAKINHDMDWVFQYFQPEIEKISQRKYTRFCYSKIDNAKCMLAGRLPSYVMSQIGKMKVTGELTESQIVDGQSEHHAAITMRNETIEVRTFKSTMDVDTIIAYIEFVRNVAHTVRKKDIKDMTLKDILASKDSPALDNYIWKLERKGLDMSKKVKDKLKYEFTIEDVINNAPF